MCDTKCSQAGRWTKCFLNRGYDDCGPGTRHRAVYCINALNRRVDASFCAGKTKPDRQGTCRVPCAEDCVVNEWSDWGDCSVSCGPNGGVRKRTRRIVAYPFNKDLNPCLPEDELTQTKPCNLHVSCHTYSWQATAWGECQLNATATCAEGGPEEGGCLMNGTASCGEGIGYQSRSVVCEEETGTSYPFNRFEPASREDSIDLNQTMQPPRSYTYSWQASVGECQLNATAIAAEGGPEEGGMSDERNGQLLRRRDRIPVSEVVCEEEETGTCMPQNTGTFPRVEDVYVIA
nr:thrombospondin type-1 domain-containing protein 7A-like [Lytechinus pictus]